MRRTTHYEIWEYCQSTSKAQARVRQNLRVRQPPAGFRASRTPAQPQCIFLCASGGWTASRWLQSIAEPRSATVYFSMCIQGVDSQPLAPEGISHRPHGGVPKGKHELGLHRLCTRYPAASSGSCSLDDAAGSAEGVDEVHSWLPAPEHHTAQQGWVVMRWTAPSQTALARPNSVL